MSALVTRWGNYRVTIVVKNARAIFVNKWDALLVRCFSCVSEFYAGQFIDKLLSFHKVKLVKDCG